jgi:hypothetical protein
LLLLLMAYALTTYAPLTAFYSFAYHSLAHKQGSI